MNYSTQMLSFCLMTLSFLAATAQSTDQNEHDVVMPLFDLLDGNRDGALDPYEALDVLRQLESQLDGEAISLNRISQCLKDSQQDERIEISEMLSAMDANGDGKTTLNELDEEMRDFAGMLDKNQDGVITIDECHNANIEDEVFMSPEEIRQQVDDIFNAFDANQDGSLEKIEADEDEFPWSQISEGDTNRDAKLTKLEMIAFLTSDNQPAKFVVKGNIAVMSGVICSDTPAKVLRLIHEHPSVRTIVMASVPGSIDDEANLRAARYVRKFGFQTVVRNNGSVASGGTDFFLAGKTRTYDPGAKFGIHSWGGPGFQGKDVPRDDPQHELYLKYYEEMGIPSEFYWRTLDAAPVNEIHWMKEEELIKFQFRTEPTKRKRLEPVGPKTDAKKSVSRLSNLRSPMSNATSQSHESVNDQVSDSDKIKATRIAKLTNDFPKRYREAFDRYVQIVAPNGKPINVFAQKEISDGQLRHVRDVMLHYLEDLPGSEFGSTKTKIANQMANNRAMMMICKGEDGQFREPRINAQPLYADETIVEGSKAYMENLFDRHRDATLEEVLHCVHDNGIGVDVRGAPQGVLPEFQKEIRDATTNAMSHGIWPTRNSEKETSDWIEELRDEGSLTQEYLASVIDSYYGLWGPFNENFGMWGIYIARSRSDIEQKDPRGFSLVGKFFHPHLTYTAEIDQQFSGTFSMTFDERRPYTHKSRYLLNAKLTGTQHSNLTGNDQNNTLAGNHGDNLIDGLEGIDTVIFPRSRDEYQVEEQADGTVKVVGDGTDTLRNIENIIFDGEMRERKRFVRPVPHGLRR